MRIPDEQLNRLGSYFSDHAIGHKEGITFEQYVHQVFDGKREWPLWLTEGR